MKKRNFRNGFFLLPTVVAVAAFAVGGCTDMTTQDYNAQQVQKQLAQDDAVAGTYNGTIASLDTRAPIGGIQITLDSGAEPTPSEDGTTTDAQAVMTGSVKIIGETTSEASFSGGYAQDTGVFTGTITIADESLTMKISGTISGSSFSGTITSDQYPGDGGSFTTVLNGSLPTAQGSSSGQVPSHLSSYAGSGTGTDCTLSGDTCDVSMTIDDSPSTSEDAFADSVVNVSNVVLHLTIDLGPGPTGEVLIPLTFGGPGTATGTAQLDKRNGTLSGQTPFGTSVASLNCTAIGASVSASGNLVNAGGSGWSCSIMGMNFHLTPSAAAQ